MSAGLRHPKTWASPNPGWLAWVVVVCGLFSTPARSQPASWKSITLSGAPDMRGVFFTDRDHGWAVGSGGSIFYTENGGRTVADWRTPATNPAIGANLWKVFFLADGMHGWAVGDSGVIVRTADGGRNWTLSSYAGGLNLRSVYFINQNVGVASATSSNRVLHSNDGGVNWTPVFADENAYDLALVTTTSGFSVEPAGGNAMVYDGTSWAWITPGPGRALYALRLLSPTSFLAVGASGGILRYTGSGWNSQTSGTTATLYGVALARTDPAQGFAVGMGGTIVHTSRADLDPSTWAPQVSNTIHDLYGVAAESADRAWAVGNFGTVLIFPACQSDQDCTGGQFVSCALDYSRCDVVTGTCGAVATGHPCDDGDICTENDTCSLSGICQPGTARSCDDGNACTDDGCDPGSGCTHANNVAACDDGNACTENDRCVNGACQSGTARSCDDGNACTDDGCDPGSGCTHANNVAACDDGNACTENDRCLNGACQSGTARSCDDGNACTDDGCDPGSGCTHVANVAACDDGDACTENDRCVNGACQSGTARSCDDGNVCTDDGCDPGSGCTHVANVAACDDGDVCTENDRCVNGACQSGTARSCDDGNVCTDDGCDPGSGCTHVANVAACDDGDVCTENDRCAGGTCGGQTVVCDDGLSCTADRCDAVQGGCISELLPQFCLIAGRCQAEGSRPPANDCLSCQSARRTDDWSVLPDDTPCGACLLCGAGVCGADPQNRPPVGADCDDGDECTPRGRCDPDMVCVIEGRCDEYLSEECRAAGRPEARYGLEAYETLNCRFASPPLALSVALDAERAGESRFFFATVRVENHLPKPIFNVRLSLEDAGAGPCLRYVAGSAKLEKDRAVAERQEGAATILELAAPPGGIPPGGMSELSMWLARCDDGREIPRLVLGGWAPCAAAPAEVGCHAGAVPDAERALSTGVVQRIAEAVALVPRVGEYRAGDGDTRPASGGCACGDGSVGAVWLIVPTWLARRRKTT